MSNVVIGPTPGICKKKRVLRDPSEKNHCVASFLQVSVILEKKSSRSAYLKNCGM